MFGRRKKSPTVLVEISDETRQALSQVDSDIQVLQSLLKEVINNQQAVIQQLSMEIVNPHVQVEDDEPSEACGVEPFAADENDDQDTHRVRSSPFTRRPRHEQEAWVLEIMSNGKWYHAHIVAREYADDERHYRYLRSAVARTMGDLFREGKLDRADSTERGSMFRYRIKP